jgi:hypothetical protein
MICPVTLPRLAPALCAIAIAMASSAYATLWVSAAGDDRNPGTEEQPIRTLEHARDVVRTLNREMTDDLTVFIAGEYRVERAIAFGPEDSGSNGFNIVYTAAPGEHPALIGAIRVTGWTVADKARNLWSAPSPAGLVSTHDLFVNGTPASRTRGRLLAVFSKEAGAAPATAPDPKAQWKNPDDVVFEPAAPRAIWSERAAPSPTFVENAFELLGTPGEWYFDRPAHRIYYTPRPGEDLATADVEAAVAQAFIAGIGSADQPITGLVFKGIRFEYTTCLDPIRGESASSPRAAVRFAHAASLQFLEDEFLHISTPALDLGPGIEGGTVEGCLFGDVSGSALRVANASAIRIAECRFSYAATDQIREGAVDVDHSEDVAIEHDQFDHYPTAAIVVRNAPAGAVRRASNWLAPPMVSLNGFAPYGPVPTPGEDTGLSPSYRALADTPFSATTLPRPPENVSAEAEDEFAYVTWIPSCRDGGSPVGSYTVESSGGAKTTVTASAFQQTGYVMMNGLEDGHPVSFTVSALNAIGSSPASLPTASVTPRQKRRLRTPPAPAAVSVTPGATGLAVAITPPPGDGGSPIVSYLVASGPAAASIAIEGLDVLHSDAEHPVVRTLPGVVPGHGSTVSVVAVNTAGEGKPAVVVLK